MSRFPKLTQNFNDIEISMKKIFGTFSGCSEFSRVFMVFRIQKLTPNFNCFEISVKKKFGAFSGFSEFRRVFRVSRFPKLTQNFNGFEISVRFEDFQCHFIFSALIRNFSGSSKFEGYFKIPVLF